ncbi:1-acyl-sn-glycerol-3-phosphate acyltransferase epsilon-like [Oppia nitens]|uniref:1-acyl-sn-glycerol-3-phosphate acyltransferase epsilon-like n=1 Tax=Oppia nitens TaxID=1686743 RepID=UPI0023DCD649|nr:1-acyl-sn-glycerol-3-phosphate acyltransferase epsilon-like [Oppia nitens]
MSQSITYYFRYIAKHIYWLLIKLLTLLITLGSYYAYAEYTIVILLIQIFIKSMCSRQFYIDCVDSIYQFYYRYACLLIDYWANIKITLYGDIELVDKLQANNVLALCNHQCGVDFFNVHYLLNRFGKLSRVRHVTTEPFQYIPLAGHSFFMHSCIYLKRGKGDKFDPTQMIKTLTYLETNNIPSWIVLYPEGTFYDKVYTDVLADNRRYMNKIGVQPFKHLLMPRSRALKTIHKQFGHRFDAVLDITIVYPNTRAGNGLRRSTPSLIEYFSGYHNLVDIHVRLIDVRQVPKAEEELDNWLYELYRQKDGQLSQYYEQNRSISEIFDCPPGQEYRSDPRTTLPSLLGTSIVIGFLIPNPLYIYNIIVAIVLIITLIEVFIILTKC